MMKRKGNDDYIKAILYSFPHLKGLSDALCDSVQNKARLSYKCYDTLTAAEKIAEEIGLNGAIRRLEEDVNGILKELCPQERYLLDYKYFHKKGAECLLKFSERSYYRKQQALLKKMSARLAVRGWTRDVFLERFSSSVFFSRVLKALQEGKERELVPKRKKKTLQVF